MSMKGPGSTDLGKVDDALKTLFEWILGANDDPNERVVASQVVSQLPDDQKLLLAQYTEARRAMSSAVARTGSDIPQHQRIRPSDLKADTTESLGKRKPS